MNNPILIGIAGGTGSGKSSIAKELLREYGPGEVVVIEQDSYYRDLSHLPLGKRCLQNFDHPDAIEFELLYKHMQALIGGSPVSVPVYDFTTHSRSNKSRPVIPHHVIVLEGILVLHHAPLRELMTIKIYVETPADIRFIRRLSRDIQERGRETSAIIDQYLKTVRPMHQQFVEPSKLFADIIIPEGGQNKVAIDLLRTKISSTLTRL